jgi:ribosomal protein S18 acetylase RimI-like enzyme
VKTRPLTLQDWPDASALYAQLNTQVSFGSGREAKASFAEVLSHPGTSVFGALAETKVVAMVTLHLLPNVTYGGRPYGLIENVVTDAAWRGQGHARAAMQAAIETARQAAAYKIMLLTGHANEAIGFYEKIGFKADEKAGMILRTP